jgi:ATP-binding cassette subfamily B protein
MFSLFKELSWFFKKNKKTYMIALISLGIVNVFEILPPRLIGMAIDDIHAGKITSSILLHYVALLLLTTIGSYVFGYIWRYQLFGGGFLLEKSIRFKIMNHLLKMKPKFYQKFRTGDIMARATSDLESIETAAGYGVLTLFDATVFMGVILLMMFLTVNWQLALAAIIPLPIHAYLMTKLGAIYDKKYDASQEAFSELNDKVLESISGMRVIRAYVQERLEIDRFAKQTEDVYEKERQVEILDSIWSPATRILVGISYFITITYGAYLILEGRMTLGDLIAFNVYLGMLIWPMFAIGDLINVMQRGKTSLERINEILDSPEDVIDREATTQTIQSPKIPEMIEFKDFNFTYPEASAPTLQAITFTIKRGETIGIVGKTGSGKTTLVRQLLKQYPVEPERLFINAIPLEHLRQKDILSFVGYVPQEHILFSRSVRENILYGLADATDDYLDHVIKLAALTNDLEFFTDGLDTIVGEKGVALSGGQKQRISIARAIATSPEILILDDSLSAVDAKTERKIIENIKEERAGKTTIITAHRMSAVKHANQIIVMEAGKISQIGTHDALMNAGGWYKEQYEHQNLKLEGAN